MSAHQTNESIQVANRRKIIDLSTDMAINAINAITLFDGDTRVYGTNVFGADNAICPVIPDINTTAPAIGLRMIN